VNVTPAQVREIANRFGWRLDIDKESYLLFTKSLPHPRSALLGNAGVIEVNLRTGVVRTTLTHPRKGRGTMSRRITGLERLRAVFEHPRVHNQGGYFPENPSGQLGAEWLTQ
jgi:hypothetical protein